MKIIRSLYTSAIFITGLFAHGEELRLHPSLWRDSTFIASFTGTFGFHSENEPTVTSEEQALFKKLVPLINSNLGQAISTLGSAMKPQSSGALDFTLGNLYFQQGNLDQAIRNYKRALQKFPQFARAHKMLGIALARNSNFAEAKTALVKTVELGLGDAVVFGLLGYVYSDLGFYASADSAYRQALLLDPENIEWKKGRVHGLMAMEQWENAVVALDELIKTKPESSEFWLAQANAFISLGKVNRAKVNYEAMRMMKKATPTVLYQLGDIYMREGSYDQAYRAYVEAMQSEKTSDVERIIRVVQNLVNGEMLDEAKKYIVQIRQRLGSSLDKKAKVKLGILDGEIAFRRKSFAESNKAFEEVITLEPLNGESLLRLAEINWRTKKFERAILYYETVRAVPEFEQRSLIGQAQMFVAKKEYRSAVALLEQAQDLEYNASVAAYLDEVRQAVR